MVTHNSKLTADKVEQIREIHAYGKASQRQIAAEFGISSVMVHKIVTGKSWKENSDG